MSTHSPDPDLLRALAMRTPDAADNRLLNETADWLDGRLTPQLLVGVFFPNAASMADTLNGLGLGSTVVSVVSGGDNVSLIHDKSPFWAYCHLTEAQIDLLEAALPNVGLRR